MAISSTPSTPRATNAAQSVVVRARDLALTLWERRPDWARDRVVAGLAGCLALLLLLFVLALGALSADRPGADLRLDQLQALIEDGRIEQAQFKDEDAVVSGQFTAGVGDEVPAGEGAFSTAYPKDGAVTQQLVDDLRKAGAQVAVDTQSGKQALRLVTTFLLPLMILANLFALLFVAGRAGGGLGGIESFGTMRGGKGTGETSGSGVTFADVAGADEAVTELQEVVDYLRDPTRYAAVGAVPPKGVLLFGPPGCGKTLIAKAVAGEADVPFFNVAGAEFVESLVGVGAARVRDLFARVREVAPAIVFIDELDAAGRRRQSGGATGGGDEREQTLNQMLVEIDGFDVTSGIVIIGATNRPDILDPALLRPGRFDRHVTVDQPDAAGRTRILGLHAKGKPMAPDVDLASVAKRTPGFTGADLANVVNEAALLTVRGRRTRIENDLLEEAVERVLHGPQRRGRVLTEDERRRAAVHEAGHALAAAAEGHVDELHKVSILARGRGVGLTSRRSDDAVLHTREDLLGELAVALGGLAAEEHVLGQSSTGGEQDLEQATTLAREIVGRYGMSDELGRVRLLAHDADEFLGGTIAMADISDATHERFDDEVRRLLDEAEQRARRIIAAFPDALDELVDTLLEREMVEGPTLQAMLAGVTRR